MRAPMRYLVPLVATAGATAAIVAASPATAEPQCINTTPTTTQCQRDGGSTQIVTGPGTYADTAAFPFPEWPWGIGGIGIGIG
jgi:hypothetical protein